MGGFRLARNITEAEQIEVTVSSVTAAEGDLLELDVGATAWTVADSSTEHWQKKLLLTAPVASTDTLAKGLLLRSNDMVIAETVNNSAAADNGDRMVLTDQNTVNNTGTDNTGQTAVFIQHRPVGAAADKRVLGWFIEGSGVNPDAA